MAYITVPYGSESVGGSILSAHWNANFQAITDGLSDGTKQLNIAALAATTGTFSGAVAGTTGTFSGAVSGTTGTFSSDLSTSGESKGDRVVLSYGSGVTDGTDYYIGIGQVATQELSYEMNRSGSIVGYSFSGTCISYTSNLSGNFRLRKNGSNLISSAEILWSSLGLFRSERNTYARGTYTFVAGDRLGMFWDYSSGVSLISLQCYVEVQFDT